jgi:uncharacterized damage-inducible protein DinB
MSEQDDLRYPIGRFLAPTVVTPAQREELIETIRQLPAKLREAVAGLSEAQLDTPYREGGWTSRQVVHHIADSHINCFVRFKLALTEDWPTIKPYDEAAWAKLADSAAPVETSLALIDGMHSRWAGLLEAMSEDDFHLGFYHPVMGRQTLTRALAMYSWHGRHHTAHIATLRKRQGW